MCKRRSRLHASKTPLTASNAYYSFRASITVCAFTTDPAEAPLFRLRVEPTERNGLRAASSLMADKLTTVGKQRLGSQIGRLDDEDVVRLNRAILVFLGLTASRKP